MSSHRAQAFVDAPLGAIWTLVGNPDRHPEWWPRVLEVRGETFDEGSNYAQVTRTPMGRRATELHIDHLDDLREIELTCQTTGTHACWTLTEATGGTFVDLQLGIDPKLPPDRLFDPVIGRFYMRRWAEQSLAGLKAASEGT